MERAPNAAVQQGPRADGEARSEKKVPPVPQRVTGVLPALLLAGVLAACNGAQVRRADEEAALPDATTPPAQAAAERRPLPYREGDAVYVWPDGWDPADAARSRAVYQTAQTACDDATVPAARVEGVRVPGEGYWKKTVRILTVDGRPVQGFQVTCGPVFQPPAYAQPDVDGACAGLVPGGDAALIAYRYLTHQAPVVPPSDQPAPAPAWTPGGRTVTVTCWSEAQQGRTAVWMQIAVDGESLAPFMVVAPAPPPRR